MSIVFTAAQPSGYTWLAAPLATLLSAFVAALLGSWVGARAALARFKQERGFEQRLDWYRRMARQLAQSKLSIEVARTFEDDVDEPAEAKSNAWQRVQDDYIALTLLHAEAPLYAPPSLVRDLRRLSDAFDQVSDASNGFDVAELPRQPTLVRELLDHLSAATTAHVAVVRRDLGFEPLPGAKIHSRAT